MESKAGLIRNNRRQKSEERTSSILKPVSTERSALTDVDLNQKDGCDIPMKKARKSSRRVSFAETYIVKEYIRESPHPWTVDNEDEPEENERDTQQEPCEPGNQTITGFDKLLTGTIWTQHDTGEVDQELLEYPLPPDSDDSIHTSHISTISQTILCNSSMDLTTCENVPPDNVYDTPALGDFGDQEKKERASSVLERILNHGKQAPMQKRKSVPELIRKSRSPLESLAHCSENDKQHVICTTSSPVQPFWQRVDQSDGDEDNVKNFLNQMFDTRKNTIQSQASFSQDRQNNEMNENACLDDAVSMELTEVFPSCIQKEEDEDCGKISVQSLLQKFAKPSQVADETNDPKILDNTITEKDFGRSDKTVCHLIGMEMTECLTNVIETKSEKQQVAHGNNINMTSHQSFGMEMTECKEQMIQEKSCDKTLHQSFRMETKEHLTKVIDSEWYKRHLLHEKSSSMTLCHSIGMEMTECSTNIVNTQADSSKRNVQKGQDRTQRQSFGMEMTECLSGVIDTTAESNKKITDSGQNKTLRQSFGMEMTECLLGVIDTRADCSEIIAEKSQNRTRCQSFGMEMPECVKNGIASKGDCKLSSVIDTSTDSNKKTTEKSQNQTQYPSFGMEMTECLSGIIDSRADNGKKVAKTSQDKTLRQSLGMEMTKCLPSVIDIRQDSSKITKPNQDRTLRQSLGMEMTECLPSAIDVRADSSKITKTNQDKTLRQSLGMEMTECLPSAIDFRADICKITKTNQDKTLRQSLGVEMTECLPSAIDVRADSCKITKTNQDKTLRQSLGMEMTECLSSAIDIRQDSSKITKPNQDRTLRQSLGMEMTECLPSAIDFRADSSKITKTNQDKTLRQSLGMEMTECLPRAIDFRADSSKITKTNQDKTLRQSLEMEMTECLPSAIDFRADSSKITKTNQDRTLRQSLGMEMTECLSSAIDIRQDSSKITKPNQDRTLRQSLGMEMTECLPSAIDVRADSCKITKSNQDKTLRQSLGMEMTECLPSAIDVRADSSKITKTNHDKTLRQSLGMEMTECLSGAIDIRQDSSKITKSNQDKTLRHSLGMEMTECLPSAIDFRADSCKITKTNQDKTLRQSLGMEMTECLPSAIDFRADSSKITKTNQDKTLRQSFGMEMTECLSGAIDIRQNSSKITKPNQDKTLRQSLGMEMTECLPSAIDFRQDSSKIIKPNQDKTLRQSLGMEMTECLPSAIDFRQDNSKISKPNQDRTLRQSLGMEMTECLPSAIDFKQDSSKITKPNQDKTLRQSLGMEMTECLSGVIDTIAESNKITKTRHDKIQQQSLGMEMTDCIQNVILTKDDSKMIIIDTNQSKTLYHPFAMDMTECLFSSGEAEKQNLGHKAVHLSEGMEMTSSSTENISNKQDSDPDKLRKADRTKCHSLGLVSTESLQASFSKDNQDRKDILENIESTQILPLGMELTECLTNIFETSSETDTLQAEKNITQFQSFEMDMTACVGNTQLEIEDSDKERTLKLSETKMYTVEMEMTNCSGGISHHKENEESFCEKNEELKKERETLNKERYTAKDYEKPSLEKVKFSRTYTVSSMTDADVMAHVGMIRNSALQEDRTSNVESTVAMEMTKCIGEFEKGEIASSVDFTKCEGFIGKGTNVDIELDSEITSNINKSIDCLSKLRSALRTPGTKSKQGEVTGPYLGQEKNNIIDFTTCAGGMQESTSTLLKGTLTNNRGCQKELTGDQMKDTLNVPKSKENRDNVIGNLSNLEKRESQKISADENIVTDLKLLHIQHKEAQLSTNNEEMGDFHLRMLKTPNERRTSSITLKRKLQHLDNFVLKGRGKTLRKSDIIGAMSSSTPSFVRSKSSGEGWLGVFESGTTLPESCNAETKADEVIHPQVEKATNFQNNELGWNSSNLKNIQDRLNSNNDDVGSLWNCSSDKDLESLHQNKVQRNTSAETFTLEDEVLQYPCGLSMSTINGNETHSTSTSSESGSETRSEEASQNKSILNALAGLSHSLCISEGPLTVDTFLKLMLAHKAERVQWTRRSSLALIPEIDPDNIDMVLVAKMKTEPEAQLYNKVYKEILAQQERNKEMNQLLDKDLEETQPPIFQSALSLSEKELHNLRKQVQSLQSACIKQTKMAWKKEMKITGEKFLAELKVNTQRTNEVTEEIVSANETITSLSEDLDSDITKLEDEIAFLESKSLLSEEELLVWQENQEKITVKRKELMDCQTRVDYHKEIKKNLMSKVDALVQEIEEVQKKIDYNQERNTDEQRKRLDDLEQQINVHQSVNEWELETLTEDLAVFLFLKGTLVLSVNIQSHEGAKVIQSVSLSSTLPENANQWDRLAHSLVLSAIDTKVLESTFRKASLPQMLHEVSCIISEARLLVRDVYLSSLRKLVIIQSDKSVTFNVYSIKTLCDILVTFRFDGKRPLSNPVQADVQTILGKVSKEQILKNLSMVRPGPRYVQRLLECINLESDVS